MKLKPSSFRLDIESFFDVRTQFRMFGRLFLVLRAVLIVVSGISCDNILNDISVNGNIERQREAGKLSWQKSATQAHQQRFIDAIKNLCRRPNKFTRTEKTSKVRREREKDIQRDTPNLFNESSHVSHRCYQCKCCCIAFVLDFCRAKRFKCADFT